MSCEVTVHVAEGNCVAEGGMGPRRPGRGGEQPECERAACRITNPFRRGVAASLLDVWRSLEPQGTDCTHGGDEERDVQARNVVGGWMLGRQDRWTGEACRTGEVRQDTEPS